MAVMLLSLYAFAVSSVSSNAKITEMPVACVGGDESCVSIETAQGPSVLQRSVRSESHVQLGGGSGSGAGSFSADFVAQLNSTLEMCNHKCFTGDATDSNATSSCMEECMGSLASNDTVHVGGNGSGSGGGSGEGSSSADFSPNMKRQVKMCNHKCFGGDVTDMNAAESCMEDCMDIKPAGLAQVASGSGGGSVADPSGADSVGQMRDEMGKCKSKCFTGDLTDTDVALAVSSCMKECLASLGGDSTHTVTVRTSRTEEGSEAGSSSADSHTVTVHASGSGEGPGEGSSSADPSTVAVPTSGSSDESGASTSSGDSVAQLKENMEMCKHKCYTGDVTDTNSVSSCMEECMGSPTANSNAGSESGSLSGDVMSELKNLYGTCNEECFNGDLQGVDQCMTDCMDPGLRDLGPEQIRQLQGHFGTCKEVCFEGDSQGVDSCMAECMGSVFPSASLVQTSNDVTTDDEPGNGEGSPSNADIATMKRQLKMCNVQCFEGDKQGDDVAPCMAECMGAGPLTEADMLSLRAQLKTCNVQCSAGDEQGDHVAECMSECMVPAVTH